MKSINNDEEVYSISNVTTGTKTLMFVQALKFNKTTEFILKKSIAISQESELVHILNFKDRYTCNCS